MKTIDHKQAIGILVWWFCMIIIGFPSIFLLMANFAGYYNPYYTFGDYLFLFVINLIYVGGSSWFRYAIFRGNFS